MFSGTKYIKLFLLFIFCFFTLSVHAFPIDDSEKYARFLDSTYGTINFNPTNGSVDVTDSVVTGYAWGSTVGWINLAPTNGGVINDGSGNLSGNAWGQNTGWINFNPTNGGVTISNGQFSGYAWSENYGWIVFSCETDSTCGTYDHGVQTTWGVTVTPSEACGNGSDDDGDGLIDYPNDPGCSSLTDTDETDIGGPPPVIPPIVPTDVCPNIVGVQAVVPAGFVLDGGNCVAAATDVCPNIAGDQATVPTGMTLDTFGNCVTPEDVIDLCPNIIGVQESVPAGRVFDAFGNCIIPEDPTDLCQNIAGEQASIPAGLVLDAFGNCIDPEVEPPIEPPIIPPTSPTTPTGPSIVGGINSVVQGVYHGFEDVYETPAGEAVTKTISTVGVVVGGGAALASLFLSPSSLVELALAPFRVWSLLLSFLGLRKRYKPWGTVYDSITKQPLDPAYVTLLDKDGKEVSSSITDIDGRYGFLTQPGQYTMMANKTNYSFPSKKLAGKSSDELYSNLYFGEPLTIYGDADVITKSIPMDPVNFDWNEFAKSNKKLMKFYSRFDFMLAKVSSVLFVLGFIAAVLALFVAPQPYNTFIFGLYVVFIILRIIGLKPQSHGYLSDKETGDPFSFAIIRVMSAGLDTEIAHKISDRAGRYFCLVPNGRYYVKIEEKKSDESYETIYTSKAMNIKKGIINQRFKI